MGIWHKECVRCDGDIMAFIKVQDDYTGNIRPRLCTMHLDGNTYWAKADGQRINMTEERNRLLRYEDKVKSALEFQARF